MKKQLHPGVKWQFRVSGYFFGLILLIMAIFFIIPDAIANFGLGGSVGFVIKLTIFLFIFLIVLIIVLVEIYARMSYNRWFYEFTDEQLRLERGIIWKKYSNIPYERVQNVDITRGIIARIFGFSTVNIQTAGYSYSRNRTQFSEGYIPAVPIDEAEHIREFIMKKITKNGRKQGL